MFQNIPYTSYLSLKGKAFEVIHNLMSSRKALMDIPKLILQWGKFWGKNSTSSSPGDLVKRESTSKITIFEEERFKLLILLLKSVERMRLNLQEGIIFWYVKQLHWDIIKRTGIFSLHFASILVTLCNTFFYFPVESGS